MTYYYPRTAVYCCLFSVLFIFSSKINAQTPCQAVGGIITVTNTNDEGIGTLRAAINCANGAFGPQEIQFNIPGNGSHIIYVGSSTGQPLPNLTDDGTVINGSTQSGFLGTPVIILDFKSALKADFNIQFHNLFAITNLPISRFLDYLIASENYEDYMYQLVEAYNPKAVKSVMCNNTISISWDGYLYDCDFNQMLGLKVASKVTHINQYNESILNNRDIVISQHCYGCTAGAGSSCQGVVTT